MISKYQQLKQKLKSLSIDDETKDELISELDDFENFLVEKDSKVKSDESYYKFLTENITDVVWVLDLNDNKFVYVSPTVYHLRGYTAEEVKSMPTQDSVTEKSAKDIENLIKEKLPDFLENPNDPQRAFTIIEQPHKNGSIVTTETSTFYRINEQNKHLEVIGVSRDITERIEKEKIIKERNREIELLLKGSRSVLESKDFSTTAQQIFEYCREITCAKAGYIALLNENGEENDIVYLEHGELPCTVNPELKMPIRGLREEVYQTSKTIFDNDYAKSPHVKFMPEGHIPLKNVMFAPIKRDGKAIGLLGLGEKDDDFNENDAKFATSFAELISIALLNSKNLEALKNRELELQKLNSDKNKFFSIIAHDLRSPLGSFKNLASFLLDNNNITQDDDTKEFLELLSCSSENLYRLLDNLLEWSRSQSGKIIFAPCEFNLNDIVNNTTSILSLHAGNKNIELINNVPQDYQLFADMNLITTVIRNLISNAIKFTNSGGKIELGVLENSNDESIIYVRDNGVGMDETTRNKLFKIEENVTNLGTNDEVGTGLGLILCKEFIDKHNGRIWVESEQGVGSTFFFSIPNELKNKYTAANS